MALTAARGATLGLQHDLERALLPHAEPVLRRLAVDDHDPGAGLREQVKVTVHVTGTALNAFANFTDGPLPNKVGYYTENAAVVKLVAEQPKGHVCLLLG